MILFSLREGFRNFQNLGIIGFLTLISLSATLTLGGFSIRGFIMVQDWTDGLLGKFEIEAFLDDGVDSTAIMGIIKQVHNLPNVGSVKFISKEEAARRFAEQFGDEVLDLLEYNPLPMSVVATLKPGSDPGSGWQTTANHIEGLPYVDDVVYQGELLAQVERFYKRGSRIVIAVIAIALILSLTFTVLTVYGSIRTREDFIHILLLCGASRSMVKGPFVAVGFYYGVVAGLFGAIMSVGMAKLIMLGWGIDINTPLDFLPLFPITGIIIGAAGAGWAAGRRIRDL